MLTSSGWGSGWSGPPGELVSRLRDDVSALADCQHQRHGPPCAQQVRGGSGRVVVGGRRVGGEEAARHAESRRWGAVPRRGAGTGGQGSQLAPGGGSGARACCRIVARWPARWCYHVGSGMAMGIRSKSRRWGGGSAKGSSSRRAWQSAGTGRGLESALDARQVAGWSPGRSSQVRVYIYTCAFMPIYTYRATGMGVVGCVLGMGRG